MLRWVPHTDWRRRAHPQFSFTPLLASSGDPLPFPWHCSAEQRSCPVIPVWWHDNIMVWGTIFWACFRPPGPALHVFKMPSLMPGWGWWTGCLGTGRKSGQRQVHPPSVLSPQLTRLLLPSIRADLSRSNLHEGRYPGPRQEIMRGKTTEDLPMPLTGTSVSTGKFPEMKDTQQAKSALAFRLSRKGSEISNHGHASLTGTWLPGHKLIRINDRR